MAKKTNPTFTHVPYNTGRYTQIPQNQPEKDMFEFLLKSGMVFVTGVKPKFPRSGIDFGFPIENYSIFYFCDSTFRQNQYIVKPVIFLASVFKFKRAMIEFFVIEADSKDKKRAVLGRVRRIFTEELGNSPLQAVENRFYLVKKVYSPS